MEQQLRNNSSSSSTPAPPVQSEAPMTLDAKLDKLEDLRNRGLIGVTVYEDLIQKTILDFFSKN